MKQQDQIFNLDEYRIYCMGFPNGGMMSYRMAIDHSDLIAGIVVIGGISYKDKKHATEFPIHVLHIHGTNEDYFYFNDSLPATNWV